jgi:hypothetical protein
LKTALRVGGILIGAGLIILLLLVHHYRAEQYQIIHAVFLTTTNQDMLRQPAALCYSNEELRQAIKTFKVLDQAGMKSFNLDGTNLIACVIPNHTVERVLGRQDFGLIILRKSPTNGISFTVIKGTKRFLQFNYQNAQ